jgi:hypothetical protein
MTGGGVFETRREGEGGAVEKEDEEEVVVVKVELEVEVLKAALFVVAGGRLRPSTSQNLGRPER